MGHRTSDTLPDAAHIVVEELGPIVSDKKIAYCFSEDSWTLLVSHSGHGKMLRGRSKQEYGSGGWAELKKGRIWDTNGTISNVPPRWRDPVKEALEKHYHVSLMWPQKKRARQ